MNYAKRITQKLDGNTKEAKWVIPGMLLITGAILASAQLNQMQNNNGGIIAILLLVISGGAAIYGGYQLYHNFNENNAPKRSFRQRWRP